MVNYKDLGKRVKILRRQLHLTQEQLAEKLGLSASFLGHIERGTRAASLETVVALCNVLDVSPEYLLTASLESKTPRMPDSPEFDRHRFIELLRMAQNMVDYIEE